MLTIIRRLGSWLDDRNRAAVLALVAQVAASAQRASTKARGIRRRGCAGIGHRRES